jgi:hypothetical protein
MPHPFEAPLKTYLTTLREDRQHGTKETSSYGALQTLCDEVGKKLKPRVRCIAQLKNRGAGQPDGGFFTADQFQEGVPDIFAAQSPARGAIEVKSTGEAVTDIALSKQATQYLERYGLLLVTNYRDFRLVRWDATQKVGVAVENYRLAENEAAFWSTNIAEIVHVHTAPFAEFLRRVLLHAAPLTRPEDLAAFLASYARDALVRVERAELPALENLRVALEEALGIHFEGEKGRHFFRSTLVQTLFYGVFSAWVLWSQSHPPEPATRPEKFDWRTSIWSLRVPMISSLFAQVATPQQLEPLGLVEMLDHAGDTLNRVDRAQFFANFETGHAVQYFYEPFLEAFDPELRKALGVWYTPPEIVEYMVARVDAVLRTELGVADGLADERVFVLDPCCGTGAYLVATLRHIERTLRNQGADAVLAQQIKKAAIGRVFGFEILPAPFVVAHLQMGLLLQQLGASLDPAKQERAGIYLTNALTGWEPRQGAKQHLPFSELEDERDAAENIKRKTPILVVIGNPPYNAFAGTSPEEEAGLVDPYKVGLISDWGIKKFNLDDLYVRFFRLAERRIAEMTGQGIMCYISNFSYLSDPSYVVMRQRLLSEFDSLWFDRMNGDSRETGKVTPEGKPDPSVFSTEFNHEGIRVGTTVGLMVRRAQRAPKPTVRSRQFWGVTKRADLVASLAAPDFDTAYSTVEPQRETRFAFRPMQVAPHYLEWPKLVDLCSVVPSNGLMEKRGGALMDMDRDALAERMRRYYDPAVSWETLAAYDPRLTTDAARFDAKSARTKVLSAESFDSNRIQRYALRPFDTRWCYYSEVRPLWNEPRPALWAQNWEGNAFLLSRMNAATDDEGSPFFFVKGLSDDHFLSPDAACFALQIRPDLIKKANGNGNGKKNGNGNGHDQTPLFAVGEEAPIANLSVKARAYLAALGITDPDADAATASLIWMHALAIGYAPFYLSENEDGVRQDWPRIPLPARAEQLRTSAALGQRVAALLDTEQTTLPAEVASLNRLGNPARVGGGALQTSEFVVTVGWGHRGDGGVTMPGKGRVVTRDRTPAEMATLEAAATAHGLTLEAALACLGEQTCDIYLNDVAYWRDVPERVWDCTIGGYQVIKKWLSYRETSVLGRPLTLDELSKTVPAMVRRMAALLLLAPALNANYRDVVAATAQW